VLQICEEANADLGFVFTIPFTKFSTKNGEKLVAV